MRIDAGLRRQFVVFVAVGATATALQYGILFIGVEWFGLNAVVASCLGFVLSAVVNYWLNYHLTFSSANTHAVAASRFVLVAVAGLAINAGLMALFVTRLRMAYALGQLLTTAIVLMWNFIGSARWTFASSRRAPGRVGVGGPKSN